MAKRRQHRKPLPKAQTPRDVIRSQPPAHWLERHERERERADEEMAARLASDRELGING